MPQPKLLIATGNPGKMREYRELLSGIPFQLVSLSDVGITGEVDETGATFHENAALKTNGYAALSGLLTLADDSGLEVDALGGAPGVYSARYGEFPAAVAGEPPTGTGPDGKMTDADRIGLLLSNLDGVPWERRTARFRCVIAVGAPDGRSESEKTVAFMVGAVAGMIQYEPVGDEGFGYDPVFYLPSYGQTLSQISLAEKNRISHRSDAARKAVAFLSNQLSALSRQDVARG